MIKKAFTLLELIFAIVIIAVMAGVGSSAFKPKYLIDDTNFIVSKIKEAQYRGIGYEHLNFSGVINNDIGCITFDKANLDENATNSNEINYKIHVDFVDLASNDLKDNRICFDSKGRPHIASFNGTLLNEKWELKLKYSNETKTITMQPITGYTTTN